MKTVITTVILAFLLFSLCWQYHSRSKTTQNAIKYLAPVDKFPLRLNTLLAPPGSILHAPEAKSEISTTAALRGTPMSGDNVSSTQLSIVSELPMVEVGTFPDGHQNVSMYVQAIMYPQDEIFPRLKCPAPTHGRYDNIKAQPLPSHTNAPKPKYFFALDLYQCVSILPRLLGSIVEAIDFLGPQSCALSIVGGRSTDGTYEVLSALKKPLAAHGVAYYFTTSDINPKAGEEIDRIQALADLRNQALIPLTYSPHTYDPDTTILFTNDVALCMEDILELIHQRNAQSADMTCAMDWIFGGWSFYDVWISRGMSGDQFFEIPQSGTWDFADNLFWNDPDSRAHLDDGRPFQVFACWNGVTAFTAKPLLEGVIRFRTAYEDECYLGEPTHFCKDLWWLGYKRIAVLPNVNVGYNDEESRKIKARHSTVSQWVERKADKVPTQIDWNPQPPEKIKCVPTYNKPSWVKWNQGLEPKYSTITGKFSS